MAHAQNTHHLLSNEVYIKWLKVTTEENTHSMCHIHKQKMDGILKSLQNKNISKMEMT